MRPNVALLSLWKAFMRACMHEFHEIENITTDTTQCRTAVVVEGIHACMHACMSSMKLKTPRPMRPRVALLSLWKAFMRACMHEFHEIENITAGAAQCRSTFVVEGMHACMHACMHEFHEIENLTTDAAQKCRIAFVVESIHACMHA
jgi:hypothetical protein